MKTAVAFIVFTCALIALADNEVHFLETSVKSNIFEPAHADKKLAHISECGKIIDEPYGIIEKTYKNGAVKNGDTCTWKLLAPANHVVHVISVGFDLENEITPNRSENAKTSTITLYDSASTENFLIRFEVSTQERYAPFVNSVSSTENLVVQINYHENELYATQKMAIKYEFIDRDKMRELLQAAN